MPQRHKYAVVVAIALTLALALVAVNQQGVYGQADGILPWVIGSTPTRGEELGVDQAVTLTFNTAMNHASVEAAFTTSPAVSGTFSWPDDVTLVFTPAKPFERSTAYIFSIDSSARSVEGVRLRDTFTLKVYSTGFLTVTQFLPEDEGYAIELQPTITLVFNRPVVPLGTAEQMQKMPAPFVSDPPIEGKGEWLTTTIYSLKPAAKLQSDTEYKITVPVTLTDVTGGKPREDLVYKFKTIRTEKPKPSGFSINYVSPDEGRTGIYRRPRIVIGFNAEPDPESVKAGFSLMTLDGRAVPCELEVKPSKSMVSTYEARFLPSVLLDYSTSYTIRLDRSKVFSKDKRPLTTKWVSSFKTLGLPELIKTTPDDGSLVAPAVEMEFRFSSPMKLDDLASRIEILPKTPVAVLDSDIYADNTAVRVQFSTLPSTYYTVTVNTKGMADVWDTPLQIKAKDKIYKIVGEDKIQFRFVTSALGAAMSLETNGQAMGIYNGYNQTRVFVTHRNINTIGLTLYSVPLMQFLNQGNQQPQPSRPEAESLVRRWVVPVYNPPNIMRYDLLSVTTNGISMGQTGNIVCVEAAPSNVAVGQQVRVVRREVPKDDSTPTTPASMNIRNQPGLQNTVVVGQAANGTIFNVLDGPVCADRYVWWKVQRNDGQQAGWMAEGDMKQPYIMPITDAATPDAAATSAATATPEATAAATAQPKLPPVAQAGDLVPGIYRLDLVAPDIQSGSSQITHLMLVATENITLKVAQHEILAWVTDLQTGKPAADRTVQFYRLMRVENQAVMRPYGPPMVTGGDGLAHFKTTESLYPGDETIYAAVTDPGHFALAASSWTQGIDISDFQQPAMFTSQDTALYIYTDRRLYRPGEVVYFKGTLRNRQDAVYSLSDKQVMPIEIYDSFNQLIYEKTIPINDFGSFSDSFTIDPAAKLGEYRIVARPNKPGSAANQPVPTPTQPSPSAEIEVQRPPSNDPQFVTEITVGDYTPPEFRVSVTPKVAHVAPGNKIQMVVNSSYYFGGPVSDAVVQWTVRTDPYYFFYTGSGNYSFENYDQDFIAQDYEDDQPREISNGKGRTDGDGQLVIELPAALGKSRRSLVYTIEAVVWDQSNQPVAERGQVVVDQGDFQVGVGTDSYVGVAGEKQTAHLIAVTPNSEGLADTALDVRVTRRVWSSVQTIEPGTNRTVWENELVEKEIAKGTVKTNAQGKADFDFTPSQGGAYKIYVSARDKRDNQINASAFLWVTGSDYVAWRAPNSNRIELQADKKAYKVGETASILIPTSFQGDSTALITVERGGVLKTDVIALSSNSALYKLPITPDMAPDAFVSVTIVKGVDSTNFTPAFRTGLLQLVVDPDQLRLNVSIKSDREKVGPREKVTYSLHVSDARGNPVKAEVGLALVDEAVLSLLPDNLPSLMAYFYSRLGLGVRTANALIYNIDQQTQEIINVQKGGGKGGSDYFGVFTVRKNYLTTPLWQPFVVTDDRGDATVTVTLPDQLTTWVLDARAYSLPTGPTQTTLVGQATSSLVSTQPLLIRPEVPRFYVVGDTSVLSAIVNNNTDQAQDVAVSVEAKGIAVQKELTQYATIPANNRLKFDWPMLVLNDSAVDLTFKVITKDGRYSDAAKPVTGEGAERLIPVLRYETPDVVTTGGVIGNDGGTRVEGVVPTPLPSPDDELQVRVDRSLASSMTDAMKALDIFPYYCMEQTVSRFLPDAVMFRAQKALGIENKALFDSLSAMLETALQRIYADQSVDKGWGWFNGITTDQLISAYTVLGLAEVKAAGWRVDDAVFLSAIDALGRSLKDIDEKTPVWDLNRQAFILYVLARASQADVWNATGKPVAGPFYNISRTVKLFNERDRMNLDAQAFLAMAFAVIEPGSSYHTKPLLDTIKKAAKYSLTGRYWTDTFADAWNWTTDTRTTAIILKALSEIEPTSDLLPDIVRWLMTARKFDRWETTQETAWSVMALTAWMKQSGDLRPDYTFNIKVNDQSKASGEKATADNVRDSYELRLKVAELMSGKTNRLTVQRTPGDGTLYYSAQLKTYLPVEQVKAISRGLQVERVYSLERDKYHRPIDSAEVGEIIRVTLTIVVPETLNYVVIEDPLPAGTQSIDTSLQTSVKLNVNQPLLYGWNYWVFTHTELRDDRTLLYAPYLPKGTYQFFYQIRAGAVGSYHVLPANGHAFYMPEVFGRTNGSIFVIKPEPAESPVF